MFSRILVAVDGSEPAQRALEFAVELAKKHAAKLIILHVVLQRVYTATPVEAGMLAPTVFVNEMQAEGETIIKNAKDHVTNKAIDYECKMAKGMPAEEIIKFATTEGADLIVVGSRGLNEVRSFLFGSVSDKVCHHVKCPTLIVK
jgi:nucleotide-binding universal stress UspA family protein